MPKGCDLLPGGMANCLARPWVHLHSFTRMDHVQGTQSRGLEEHVRNQQHDVNPSIENEPHKNLTVPGVAGAQNLPAEASRPDVPLSHAAGGDATIPAQPMQLALSHSLDYALGTAPHLVSVLGKQSEGRLSAI